MSCSASDLLGSFTRTANDAKFTQQDIIEGFPTSSVIECAGECLRLGRFCKSFSFSKSNLCTLSGFKISDPSQTFVVEGGTELYDRILGKIISISFDFPRF